MDMEELRGQAAAAFRALDVPEELTLESLRNLLEEDRGKEIIIRPVERLGRDKISGLWFSLPDADLVLHADTASPLYREQIILHEFAHMVLDHERLMGDESHLASLLPDLNPSMVSRCLARCQRQSEPEIVAESLADLFADALARTRLAGRVEPLNFRGVFG
ncbi:hypothetical protein [Sinomonas sp. ASV322]|uniref:hypothetical protein n=1 Tax=Sinomonas sp. ASV322 TaxID=3041920 RepID=UPI0027DCD545|nr:hypothetical protein [Sinomonas sp. ASV322]MDQ4504512.1 hypothetical protein [Sinomonas sp. ASV322]